MPLWEVFHQLLLAVSSRKSWELQLCGREEGKLRWFPASLLSLLSPLSISETSSTPVWRPGTRLLKAPGEEGILPPISLPWACFMSQTTPGVGERKWLGFAYSPIPENRKVTRKQAPNEQGQGRAIFWAQRGPFAAEGRAPIIPVALVLSTSTQEVQDIMVLFLTGDI